MSISEDAATTAGDSAAGDAPGDTAGGASGVPAARFRRPVSQQAPRWILVVVVAVAIAAPTAVAVTYATKYYDARSSARQSVTSPAFAADAMDTARRYAAELLTYDAADYDRLDARIRQISTPAFADTYIRASAQAREGNAAVSGSSHAESKEAGIESISPTRAVVLATLDQTVTSPQLTADVPAGVPYQSRVRITLVRQDGHWRIDDFAVV